MENKERSRATGGQVRAAAATPASRTAASIIGIALSLGVLGMLIRARLTGILILYGLGDRLTKPAALVDRVLFGTYWDAVVLVILTLPFLCLTYVLRRRDHALRALCIVYCILAALVLAAEAVNPLVVFYLGTPFTVQWLYYSDFLRGLDARNSILGVVDKRTIAVAIVVGVSFVILALLLRRLLQAAAIRRYRRRLLVGSSMLVAAYFALGYFELNRLDLQHSTTANPVIVFVDSLLPHDVPAIYTMATPIGSDDFEQAKERNQPPSVSATAPVPGGIKNVIVFVLESVSSKYIETYGSKYPVTPVLNKYRSHAMTFDSIYAHTANTNVSIVALLTSTYPWLSTRLVTKEHPDLPVHSLTGELRQRGYGVAYFTSADALYDGQGDFLAQHDLDVWQDYRSIPCDRPINTAGFDQTVHDLITHQQYYEGVHDDCTAEALNRWVDAQGDHPFFALLWTYMTHHPYFISGRETDYAADSKDLNRYLNALRVGDEALGKVLQHLEATALADSTLVVVLGDHGESFGHHGQVAHAINVYDENLHIPFFLINPRAFKGETSATVGGIVDIAPTILDILRLPSPGDWQGRSLFAPQRSPRTYFFTPWADLIYGYRQDSDKYIYNVTTNKFALYDLAADPDEAHNMIDEHPEMKDEVTNRLAAWIQYQNRLMAKLTSVASEPPAKPEPSRR
ncbi:MAG TPA: sulfatase-like hydrolase/transferase [Stellaceae bacterium]|nr:sulfatase-like hydrolase/transferase [Stellaceae bacterium]